jgi:hypothetical protein
MEAGLHLRRPVFTSLQVSSVLSKHIDIQSISQVLLQLKSHGKTGQSLWLNSVPTHSLCQNFFAFLFAFQHHPILLRPCASRETNEEATDASAKLLVIGSVLLGVELMFQIHFAGIQTAVQSTHFLLKGLSAAAVVELLNGNTKQLHFNPNWVTKTLSPKLQMLMEMGLRSKQLVNSALVRSPSIFFV